MSTLLQNLQMYEMYPDIHHLEGTRMAVNALRTLQAGSVFRRRLSFA
jgi:hypothetical protein